MDGELPGNPVPEPLLEATRDAAHWLAPLRVAGYMLLLFVPLGAVAAGFSGKPWWPAVVLAPVAGVGLAVSPEVHAWRRVAVTVRPVIEQEGARAATWLRWHPKAACFKAAVVPLGMCTVFLLLGFLAVYLVWPFFLYGPMPPLGQRYCELVQFWAAPLGMIFAGMSSTVYAFVFAQFRLLFPPYCRLEDVRIAGCGFWLGSLAFGWAVLAAVLSALFLA